MKRPLIVFLVFYALSIIAPPITRAIVDPLATSNNKIGIHLLDIAELPKAAEIVNSNGGDWGYITIPIQPTDRDKIKWNQFMLTTKQLHLIPILRVTTIPNGGTWNKGTDTDLVDFANFLLELNWPTKNRYIVIFNEVNRAQEWGGEVNPGKYAKILKNAHIIFKERSNDFFILPAGLDSALPNTDSSMSFVNYIKQMQEEVPDIWEYIDGWTSHAYPNPAFSASPHKIGWQSITSYKQELAVVGKNLPVFITESGWDNTKFSSYTLSSYYNTALDIWLSDENVVSANIFLLNAQDGPFTKFSLLDKDGNPAVAGTAIANYPKVMGEPIMASGLQPRFKSQSFLSRLAPKPFFTPFTPLIRIENLIRRILGLPQKFLLSTNSIELTIEVVSKIDDITKGLSERKSLNPKQGMLFVFNTPRVASFWMKGMNFPIDIIWIKNNAIVDVSADVQPEESEPYTIYSPNQSIDMVLEIGAGLSEKYNLTEGQVIEIRKP